MNNREKEEYLREYEYFKKKGKPFFPYAVAKDSAMALVVVIVICVMALFLGAEQGPKADPTTTTYVPRPEWYFFFLFEVLRIIKPPELTPLATIGVPTIAMVLLFLLPFYDRSAERHPAKRPIATAAGILTIVAMAYLTLLGATAGSPTDIELSVASEAGIAADEEGGSGGEEGGEEGEGDPQLEAGKQVAAQSGCLACHVFGENGNHGPGPDLTEIGNRLPAAGISRSLLVGPGLMPSYSDLQQSDPEKFDDLVAYLASLTGE